MFTISRPNLYSGDWWNIKWYAVSTQKALQRRLNDFRGLSLGRSPTRFGDNCPDQSPNTWICVICLDDCNSIQKCNSSQFVICIVYPPPKLTWNPQLYGVWKMLFPWKTVLSWGFVRECPEIRWLQKQSQRWFSLFLVVKLKSIEFNHLINHLGNQWFWWSIEFQVK